MSRPSLRQRLSPRASPAARLRLATSDDPLRRSLRLELLEDRRLLSITVNTLVDEEDGSIVDGDISLRDAIAAADPAETINFSVTGTINLNHSQFVIDKNLIISGPGASLLTINALGQVSRVFLVDDGNTGTLSNVEIRGLTLTGGDPSPVFSPQSGGAIWTNENLVVADCIITGNRALVPQFYLGGGGGIYSSNGYAVPNSLTVLDTTISGNESSEEGGGIRKRYGSLVVERSTISGNTAARIGGGISAADGGINVQIRDSTISGNRAGFWGGGIFLSGTTTTITGSTISGNSAAVSGGGIFGHGLTVRHSTIAFNKADSDNNLTGQGGGLYTYSAILDHTIVAKNTRRGTTDDDVFGAATANFSLISTTAGATIDGANNVLGQDPLLRPLANNGGPTETHALLAGSPAIDMGDPAFVPPPANDQRGAPFMRLADGDGAGVARIDIGAYERQNFNLVVDTLVDEDDGDHSAGDFSLREAIAFANTNDLVLDAITFAPHLTSGGPATIQLALGELAIHDSMTIDGPGANLLSIDGGASRIFNIDNGSGTVIDVELVGLSLIGGNATAGSGGAIFNRENLLLSASTISGNSASNFGGGIYNAGGSVSVTNSTVTANDALSGGGIASASGSLQITASTISGNSAINHGGGIFHENGNLTVVNSTLSGNIANNQGGGIYSRFGQLTLRHSTVSENQALAISGGGYGGAGIMRPGYDGFNPFLENTIIAGNTRQFGDDDLSGQFRLRFSLVGRQTPGSSIIDDGGNLIGSFASPLDPLLGPLANNGGATMTHALLSGGPAIDRGDSAAMAGFGGVPPYDQRGFAFNRVVNGRIDMGAFERGAVSANFDIDLDVDGFDFLAWQRGFGATGALATPANGNADGDSDVDGDDLAVWKAQFGSPPQGGVAAALGGASFASTAAVTMTQATADALFASADFSWMTRAAESFVLGKRRGWRRG